MDGSNNGFDENFIHAAFEDDAGKRFFARIAKKIIDLKQSEITPQHILDAIKTSPEIQTATQGLSQEDAETLLVEASVTILDTLENINVLGAPVVDDISNIAKYNVLAQEIPQAITDILSYDPVATRLANAVAQNPANTASVDDTPFEQFDVQTQLITPLRSLFADGADTASIDTNQIRATRALFDKYITAMAVTSDLLLEQADAADEAKLKARLETLRGEIEDIRDSEGVFADRIKALRNRTINASDVTDIIDDINAINQDFKTLHDTALHPETITTPSSDNLMGMYGVRVYNALLEENRDELNGLSINEATELATQKINDLTENRFDRYTAEDIAEQVVTDIVANGKDGHITLNADQTFDVAPQISASRAAVLFNEGHRSQHKTLNGKTQGEAYAHITEELRKQHPISLTNATLASGEILEELKQDGTLNLNTDGKFAFYAEPDPTQAQTIISRLVGDIAPELIDSKPRALVPSFEAQVANARSTLQAQLDDINEQLADEGFPDTQAMKERLEEDALKAQAQIDANTATIQQQYNSLEQQQEQQRRTITDAEKLQEFEAEAARNRNVFVQAQEQIVGQETALKDGIQRNLDQIIKLEARALKHASDHVKTLLQQRDALQTIIDNGQSKQVEIMRMHEEAMWGVDDGKLIATHTNVFLDRVQNGYTLTEEVQDPNSTIIKGYVLTNTDPAIGSFNVKRKDSGTMDISFMPGEDEDANQIKAIEAANIMMAEALKGHTPNTKLEFNLRGSKAERAIMQVQLKKLAAEHGTDIEFTKSRWPGRGEVTSEKALSEARNIVSKHNRIAVMPDTRANKAAPEFTAYMEEQTQDQPAGGGLDNAQETRADNDRLALKEKLYNAFVIDAGGPLNKFESAWATLKDEMGITEPESEIKAAQENLARHEAIAQARADEKAAARAIAAEKQAQAEAEAAEQPVTQNDQAQPPTNTMPDMGASAPTENVQSVEKVQQEDVVDPEYLEMAKAELPEGTPEGKIIARAQELYEQDFAYEEAQPQQDIDAAKGQEQQTGLTAAEIEAQAALDDRMHPNHQQPPADIVGEEHSEDKTARKGRDERIAAKTEGTTDTGEDTAGGSSSSETPAVEAATETPQETSNTKVSAAVKKNISNAGTTESRYQQAGYAKALATSIVAANQHVLENGELPDQWEMPTAKDVQTAYRAINKSGDMDRIVSAPDESKDPLRALVKDGFFRATGTDAGELKEKQIAAMAKVLEENGVTPEIAKQTVKRQQAARRAGKGGGAEIRPGA